MSLNSSFINIRPVGAELFHADGRTDVTKIIVACRNFANALKNFCSSKNKYAMPTSSF